jgi:hypothetical protein
MIRTKGGTVVLAAMAAAAGISLAACSSSNSSTPSVATSNTHNAAAPTNTASPASGSPTASPAATGSALANCATSSLTVSLDTSQGSGAAGSTYVPIDFTNTSSASCVLYGYPGVSFVTGSGGSQIGQAATRSPAFSKVQVTLAPGGSAHAWLQIAEAGNYPSSTCDPATAPELKIFPPGETVAAYVSHAFDACKSTKVSILTINPVRSGKGSAGTVP